MLRAFYQELVRRNVLRVAIAWQALRDDPEVAVTLQALNAKREKVREDVSQLLQQPEWLIVAYDS